MLGILRAAARPATRGMYSAIGRTAPKPGITSFPGTRGLATPVSDYVAKQLTAHDPRALCRAVERGTLNVTSPAVAGAYLAALHRLGRDRMARDLYARFVESKGGPPFPGHGAGMNGGINSNNSNSNNSSSNNNNNEHQSQQSARAEGILSGAERLIDGRGTDSLRVKVVNAGEGAAGKASSRLSSLTWLLIGGLAIYYMYGGPEARKSSSGGGLGGVMSMARQPVYEPEKPTDTKFTDVVGVEEAKESLSDIVEFLRDPERFSRLGGEVPKGVLLTGPPGTGKTLLARAVAGEAGCSFFQTNGASFEEMFVGVGAKRIRSLFEAAERHSPSIIFIDEIDAVAGRRGRFDNPASRMSVNQLLSEMDGFEQNRGIIVIAATNLPDGLDPAILRAGRFDNQIHIPPPDVGARRRLLSLYLSRVVTHGPIDTETLARGTVGMTGADIKNLINAAAVRQAKFNKPGVDMESLEKAKDDAVMGGPERRSAVITPEALRVTAYHESGHALVALSTAGANPVYKATVVPRGRALGLVMQLPARDETSITREQLLARMDVCMGGRAAEEAVLGAEKVTSGASSDFAQATNLAREMVLRWGMSNLGVSHIDDEAYARLGSAAKERVDAEVDRLLSESMSRAREVLSRRRDDLERLAKALLEYETLSGEEVSQIVEGREFVRTLKPSRDMPGSGPPAATGEVVGLSARDSSNMK